MKIPNIGEYQLLSSLITNVLDTMIIRLYKNEVVITPDTVIEDITEADFSGYTEEDGDLTMTGNTWGSPTYEDGGAVTTTGDTQCEWIHNGGGVSNTIYGQYGTDVSGNLIYVEAFTDGNGDPAPFVMDTNGATLRVTPFFLLQSWDEVCQGPQLMTATIPETGDSLALEFDRTVTNHDGFTVDPTGGAATLTYDSGDGTATLTFTTDRTILGAETVTLDVTDSDVVDDKGRLLANVVDFDVTNNSTQV